MKDLRIIFVDQLSINNSVLDGINPNDTLLFYEPIDTFYEIKHHKQKIALLVSALRHFIKKINHDMVNKKYACIEIKDNGIGMDKETLQKV